MTKFYVDNGFTLDVMSSDELKALIADNKETLKSPRHVHYKGYKLEVACNPYGGHLMGYIEGSFDIVNPIYNESYVHGDWTYPYDELDSSEPIVKIGFDCGHSSDLTEDEIDAFPDNDIVHGKSYKNVDFVFTELKRAINEYLGEDE